MRGRFTDEQRWWLEKMAEQIESNLRIEAEEFELASLRQRGGLGKAHQLVCAELPNVHEPLNMAIVA